MNEARLGELTHARVILNILNLVFQFHLKQLNTSNRNYFVQDYLRQTKDEFLENENYTMKSLTTLMFFPFKRPLKTL